MTSLTLRALRAKHGDSLLLFARGATVLIDGGPSGVYRRALRDQLKALAGSDGQAPVIDLMMVSHIDADHIDGILDLTAELIEDQQEERQPLVTIREAWHNSFADTVAKSTGSSAKDAQESAASVAGMLDLLPIPKADLHDSRLILSSVGQGRQLRHDLGTLQVDLNRHFDGDLVLLEAARQPWQRGGLRLDVIGPGAAQVEKLKRDWVRYVKKILAREADAETAARSMDRSVSNLASIVAIAEADGKRALLTGDARGEMIMEWLEATGRLEPDGTVRFDIVKLPHHGSDRNVTPEFFERVLADHYVICGDGKHGNPEPHMLEMLFAARPALDFKVHMTYSPEEIKTHREFIEDDLGPSLDAVLAPPGRRDVLKTPDPGTDHVDIAV